MPHDEWQPPEPSRMSRDITMRWASSYRGTIVDRVRNRSFNYESKPERDFLYIALASRMVLDICEQAAELQYLDALGKLRSHFIDFLLLMHSGLRVAIAVKASVHVEKSGIREVLKLLAEQVGPSFADRYVLRTEQDFHPDDVEDARLILRARSLPDPAADEAITQILGSLRSWCRLQELAEATGRSAGGFNGIVRLIDQGVLIVKDNARISLDCFVRPTVRGD